MPRILIVDDDPGTIETFGAILRMSGFDVSIASTGRAALQLIRDSSYDILLVDVYLNDMSGLDLLRESRRLHSRGRVVMMTAFGSVQSAVEAMRLGALDYVQKPLSDEQLVVAVRSAADPASSADASTCNIGVNCIRSHASVCESSDWRVASAVKIAGQRFPNPRLRLSGVARELEVSAEHLCRLLKKETGSGFGKHVERARVREAQRLLLGTNLSIKEIAYQIGYATTTRLDRYFKRACGELPSAFRKARRKV